MVSTVLVSIVTYESDLGQLRDCIASLDGQCDGSYQLYIVDCASSPDYRASLQEFATYATIIDAPRNGGFGYGHNLAWMRADPTDYVLILNPDVILHANALRALISHFALRPHAGLVVPKVFYPDGTLQPLNKRLPNVLDLALRLLAPPALTQRAWVRMRLEHYTMLDEGYDHAYRLDFASGCCMLFRRDILLRLGGFDEKFFLYFEDADITQRVNCIAQSWFCPTATITHAWQRGSRRRIKLLLVMLHSAARYFAKWDIKWW